MYFPWANQYLNELVYPDVTSAEHFANIIANTMISQDDTESHNHQILSEICDNSSYGNYIHRNNVSIQILE